MTITYKSNVPTESGVYLVRQGGELTIAEFDAELESWTQLGIEYDIWTYSEETYEIEVIGKLKLRSLELKFKKGDNV